jgi:hypothetical protein
MPGHDRVTTFTGTLRESHGGKPRVDRRREKRQVMLLRVALLHGGGTSDICVVKNVSPNGLSARVYQEFAIDERVQVEFRSGELLSGFIIWKHDWEVGIAFLSPIDVETVLASRWITEVNRQRTLPRIELACRGRLKTLSGSLGIMLQDISQGGARMQIDAPLPERQDVVLSLPDLPPTAGVVRWVSGDEIGISFNQCIAFERLARWIQARRTEHWRRSA